MKEHANFTSSDFLWISTELIISARKSTFLCRSGLFTRWASISFVGRNVVGLQLYVFPFHLSDSHPCFLHQPPPTLHHYQLQLYAALHLQHQWNGGRHRPGWCGEYQRVNQDRPPGPVVPFALCPLLPALLPSCALSVAAASPSWESAVLLSWTSSTTSFVSSASSSESGSRCAFFLEPGDSSPLICSIGCPLSWLGSRSPLASHVLVVGCTWVSFLSSDARPMGSKWFRCNVLLELLSASL